MALHNAFFHYTFSHTLFFPVIYMYFEEKL